MEPGSWKAEAALGALVVGVLVAFVWLTFAVGGSAPHDAHRYVLILDSALGLSKDNAVAIAGVKVGIVEHIVIDGRLAKVSIALEPGVALHKDARAALRQKTLLGEKYVALDPGAPPSPVLLPGSVLADNLATVEIDKVIRDVSLLVERLNDVAPPLLSAIARIDKLLQSEGGQRLEGDLTETLADVRALVKSSNRLVQSSGEDVSEFISLMSDKAPALADSLMSTSSKLDDILASLDPKVIKDAASKLAPASENIEKITGDLRTTMNDFRSVAKRLDSVLARVDKALLKIDGLDEKDVREFLQVQGVRVNLIPDVTVRSRLEQLRDEGAAPAPE